MKSFWNIFIWVPWIATGILILLAVIYWVKEGVKLFREAWAKWKIRVGNRKAWEVQKARRKLMKRQAKEVEIGETIFRVLEKEHDSYCYPSSRQIGVAYPINDRPCEIEVRCWDGCWTKVVTRIIVDLTKPSNKQISIWVNGMYPAISEREFPIAKGLKWVESHVSLLYPCPLPQA